MPVHFIPDFHHFHFYIKSTTLHRLCVRVVISILPRDSRLLMSKCSNRSVRVLQAKPAVSLNAALEMHSKAKLYFALN